MFLYHASIYRTDDLKPGLKRSGVLQRFEDNESNEYLYACRDKDESVLQGFFAAVTEVNNRVKGTVNTKFTSAGRFIHIQTSNRDFDLVDVLEMNIYLYTFRKQTTDEFSLVRSGSNLDYPEYKTKNTIAGDRLSVEVISLKDWSKQKDIRISYTR